MSADGMKMLQISYKDDALVNMARKELQDVQRPAGDERL